jgi:DNA-binding MarR family transcriptional regulator
MSSDNPLDKQVNAFHRQMVDLIKKYQFRDRNETSCSGVSVSQCYVLEALDTHGPLTMNTLAEKMHLTVSTITRVIDQLVKKKYVTREEDVHDRRVRRVKLTEAGTEFHRESWKTVFESEKSILNNFPAEHRDMLIDFLEKLNEAVSQWRGGCKR